MSVTVIDTGHEKKLYVMRFNSSDSGEGNKKRKKKKESEGGRRRGDQISDPEQQTDRRHELRVRSNTEHSDASAVLTHTHKHTHTHTHRR